MSRVDIKPELFRWARERSGLDGAALAERFPKYAGWESGEVQPTLKQLEDFAKKTLTPFGYLFLPEPPQEQLPIPDFRTLGSVGLRRPSAQLLETLYVCLRRQDWYRNYAMGEGITPLRFIGKSKTTDAIRAVAESIRQGVGLSPEARAAAANGDVALRVMFAQVEEAGILVMRNGVVGNNNRQRLSVSEFRGFALSDNYAPLIFINAADTKAAQMFTLAHELAHLWVGRSGVSNLEETLVFRAPAIETFCNKVAAEALVPLGTFRSEWRSERDPQAETIRMARRFRVSTLVIIRRAYDAGFLDKEGFAAFYKEESKRLARFGGGGGGDFYRTQTSRLGRRFPTAIVNSTLEGKTLYAMLFACWGFPNPKPSTSLQRN